MLLAFRRRSAGSSGVESDAHVEGLTRFDFELLRLLVARAVKHRLGDANRQGPMLGAHRRRSSLQRERHLNIDAHRDGLTVLRSRLEFPLLHRFDGLLIESMDAVERLRHFDVTH